MDYEDMALKLGPLQGLRQDLEGGLSSRQQA
jgi:hypothetical protein